MLKKIVLTLLLAGSTAFGQSFTNTVDKSIRNQISLSYTVIPQQVGATVDQPLSLWFTYSGNIPALEGSLSHNGTTVTLFNNLTPSSNPVVISPINDFLNEPQQGAWILHLIGDSHNPFTLNQWGINQIPEPSALILLSLSIITFLIRKK